LKGGRTEKKKGGKFGNPSQAPKPVVIFIKKEGKEKERGGKRPGGEGEKNGPESKLKRIILNQ